tara:strand:+ start:3061 stop:3918 length:858 start_codon:yes stop_codon:yes gene_type:complete
MFYAKHLNPKKLEKLFKTVEDIVNDINFNISKEGISFRGMDSSHCTLLDSFISSDEFKEYRFINKDDNVIIGINMKSFCKLLSISENSDSLILEIKDINSDKLKLLFDNESRSTEYNLNLLTINSDDIDIAKINYNVIIDIDLKRLNKVCQEINIIESDNAKFIIMGSSNDKIINIVGDGNIGSSKTTLKKDYVENPKKTLILKDKNNQILNNPRPIINKPDYIVNDFNEDFNIEFSIKNIDKIIKLYSIIPRAILNIGKEAPLKISFNIGKKSYLDYYIAPKID